MTRAILFDVDGVLLHSMFHTDPARCRRWDQHMVEDIGISRDMMQGFFKEKFSAIVRGQTSLLTELADFLPTIGFKHSPLDFLAYWFRNDSHLNLPLLKAIKQLSARADVSLYMATNQEHLRAFHIWNQLGLNHIFKDMFYAARFGEAKPDKAYFDAVDRLLGPQSEPPLFFDDGPRNIESANAHGWEACLFDTIEDFTSHPWVAKQLNNN